MGRIKVTVDSYWEKNIVKNLVEEFGAKIKEDGSSNIWIIEMNDDNKLLYLLYKLLMYDIKAEAEEISCDSRRIPVFPCQNIKFEKSNILFN